MLNLDDLLAVTGVVSEGSIRAAAERLHKTPSAISQSIKRIETALDLKIFDRSGYRMILNGHGMTIYKQAQIILKEAHKLDRIANLVSSGQEQSFSISVNHIIPKNLYLPMLTEISDQFPDTDFSIIKDSFGGPHHRLEEETVDLAIVCGNPLSPLFDETESLPIGKVELVYVIHQDLYNTFNARKPLTEEIAQFRQVNIGEGSGLETDNHFLPQQNKIWRVNDLNTKLELILSAKGWGRLPTHCIRGELKAGTLINLSQEKKLSPAQLNVSAIRNSNRPPGVVGSKVWGILSSAVADL